MTARTVIHVGDALAVLKTLPSESVQCIVTSPPYYGLRDYQADGQLGLEPTPDEYVARLVTVFAEARRVLREDGVLWLNLGDSYANTKAGNTNGTGSTGLMKDGRDEDSRLRSAAKTKTIGMQLSKMVPDGLKPKDLIGIPWRVAFALQADGWWLRSDCIWHKPNPMPESVTDRPTKAHEYVFLLSKSARYFYDAEAVAEESIWQPGSAEDAPRGSFNGKHGDNAFRAIRSARNRRTVWTITPQPYSGAHFATMPPDLVEVCVKAGTSERGCCPECGAAWERVTSRGADRPDDVYTGTVKPASINGVGDRHVGMGQKYQNWLNNNPLVTTGWRPTCDHDADPVPCAVLDPFGGAGTTGLVANRLDRDAVLIELNADYAEMARERIYGDAPMFANVEVV